MNRPPRLVTSLVGAVALLLLAAPAATQLRNGIKAGYWTSHIKKRYQRQGWSVYESRSYQIQSEIGMDKAKRLAKHMEAMLKVYKKLFPADKGSFKRFAVKLFKDREAFVMYGRAPGAAAYYSPTEKEMVCYDTGRWMDEAETPLTGPESKLPDFLRNSRMDILGAAAHEGWHQYFHYFITSWVPINSWIIEGMGDYFYAARPIEKKGKRGVKAELGRINDARMMTIYMAVKRDRHVPIKEILHYSQREYYANPGVCYAEGWALCHFLQHTKKYKNVIKTFIFLVRDDTNMKKITEIAFRGIDLDTLDEEFKAWVLETGEKELQKGKKTKKKGGDNGKTDG